MANELLLTGVPAFVGQVLSPTRVKFFVKEDEFDLGRSIEVDLHKNPRNVAPAAWAKDVECDHPFDGGRTTIGPKFHDDAKHVGCVYLSERLIAQHAKLLAGWPEHPEAIYQYQLVLREGAPVQRFHGFKVRVVSPAVGSLVGVEFFRAGVSTPFGVPRWIDLANPDVCDPPANRFTTITPSSPVGTEGALFMSSRVITTDAPSHPKIPRAQGW